MTVPVHRCPLCGAESTAALPCPRCGAEAPSPSGPALQPAFELGWGAGRAGAGNPVRRFPAFVVRALTLAGETAWALALRPEASFRSFRREGGIWPPLAYTLLLGGPCLLLGVLVRKLILPGEPGADPAPAPIAPGTALFLLLAAPPIYLYVRSQALHLGLVLTGRARSSFLVTLRISAYANASAAPLLLVPIAGEFLFLLWGAYLEATGVRFAHRLTPAAAAAAEALPAAVMVLAFAAAAVVGVFRWTQARG